MTLSSYPPPLAKVSAWPQSLILGSAPKWECGHRGLPHGGGGEREVSATWSSTDGDEIGRKVGERSQEDRPAGNPTEGRAVQCEKGGQARGPRTVLGLGWEPAL